MKGIKIQDGVIEYFGSQIGYVNREGTKGFIDPMFRNQLMERFMKGNGMETEWKKGLYDKLASGEIVKENGHVGITICRIWQLKPEVDAMMKFTSFEKLAERYGEPDMDNYVCVYEGETGTKDLERLYEIFNIEHPEGFKGHSLTVSDIIELSDDGADVFYYVDSIGFKELAADSRQEPELGM